MEPLSNTTLLERIQKQFLELNIQTTPQKAERWSDEVLLRYNESWRFYHTLSHIDSMLLLLFKYGDRIQNKTVVKLAIFFHDIVYDPTRKDNEVESIKSFKLFARDVELPEETTALVSAFIKATITHSLDASLASLNDGGDLKLFLDFDLEVLSRDEPKYQTYAKEIRMEYSHVPDHDYWTGRIKVLSSFLDRERIYFSDLFHDACEVSARRNVTREHESLRALLSTLDP